MKRAILAAVASALAFGCETGSSNGSASDAAKPVVFGFEGDALGALPSGWKVEGTKQTGPLATWQVVEDLSAPSPPRALALTATKHGSGATFNLCWTDEASFLDGAIEVAFKPVGGGEDQGGGPIWRVQDANNYYVCRANPLENNFRVYCVQDGSRQELASASVEIQSGVWHRIRIEHMGARIVCFLDERKLLEATDDHIAEAGGLGLWTKADALTAFDDLRVKGH